MAPNFTTLGLSANGWEWIDILGIGLVFIGVVAECAHETKRFRRARVWRCSLGAIGVRLVALGLRVELICAPIVWSLNAKEIERERQARVEVEKKLAWRTLTEVQVERFRDKLLPFAGVEVLTPSSEGDEPEMNGFESQIHDALQMARWRTHVDITPRVSRTGQMWWLHGSCGHHEPREECRTKDR